MDTLDDDIIRLELGGILVSELIYEFDMATKPNPTHVIGLTVHGANEMARLALRETRCGYSLRNADHGRTS